MTLTSVPVESKRGLSTTVAWRIAGDTCYALKGNVTNTGGTIEWLGEVLSLNNPAEGVAKLANTVSDSCGVYIVPALQD